MTTAAIEGVVGTGNISINGDVRDINQTWTKVQLYGDASGYHDIVVRDEIDPGYVTWLRERFVEPGNYLIARQRLLDEERTVFIKGEPGCGLWTAAVCLLAERSESDRPTIKVIDVDVSTRLDLRRVPQGALVLLDLAGADRETLEKIEPQLKNFKGTVAGAGGRLVVLMSGLESPDIRASYSGRIVSLLRPSASAVASKHLEADGLPGAHIVEVPQVKPLLKLAAVADAARLADLVRQEYPSDGTEDERREAIARAVDAYDDWSSALVTEYDGTADEDIETRSLLLAVALLNHGGIEPLYQAELILHRLAGYTKKNDNLLAGQGFAGRLKKLPSTDYHSGRAWFTRRAYDASVLRHVWNGYPELREKLVDWVVEVGQSVVLSEVEARDMVDRFAEFCASQDIARTIGDVAKKWALSGKAHGPGLAARLLTVTALDGRVSAVVHRQLYGWARQKDLPKPQADVVQAVCMSEFGRVHTDKALTRLGNLANHNDKKISGSTVDAVRRIAKDNGAFAAALGKLTEWLADDKDRRKVIATQILTELTDPGAGMLTPADLEPQSEVRALLVRAWGSVLGIPDTAVAEPAVAAWLSTAVARREQCDPMVDVIVDAAKVNNTSNSTVGNLITCLYRWHGPTKRHWPTQEGDTREAAVYDEVMARITGAETPTPLPIGASDG